MIMTQQLARVTARAFSLARAIQLPDCEKVAAAQGAHFAPGHLLRASAFTVRARWRDSRHGRFVGQREGWLMLREWRIVILVGIVCLCVGIVFGRVTSSGSRKSDVSVDSKTYATCMALWRDEADCAEVMKRLNAWTHETPN